MNTRAASRVLGASTDTSTHQDGNTPESGARKASQCSNIHTLAVIHRAEALACVSLGRPDAAPEGGFWSSGYRVLESDERARSARLMVKSQIAMI